MMKKGKIRILFTAFVLIVFLAGYVAAQWNSYYSAVATLAAGDLILVQDVSDTTDGASGTTVYITFEDFEDSLTVTGGGTGDITDVGDCSTGDCDAKLITFAAGSRFIFPLHNDPTTPEYAFGDGDTGFYEISDDTVGLAIAGALKHTFDSTGITVAKVSGTAGSTGVYEANSTDTSVAGFRGPASIADDMWYVFPNADPAAHQIWTFGATASNESDISLNYIYDAFEFVIDGGGSAITTGVKGDLEIPFGFVVERATVLADQSGSIVVDIWSDTYANFPPTDADTITSTTPPTITSTTKSQDTTLTSWTTALVAGSVLRFNVDSCSTIERVTVSLKGYRTF